jgi:HSP20 family molecular chaperone IbpA
VASGRSWEPWHDDAHWRREFGSGVAGERPRASEQWVWGAAPVAGAGAQVRYERQGDHLVVDVRLPETERAGVDVHVGRSELLVRGVAGSRRIDLPVAVQADRARVRRSREGFEVTVPTAR